MQLLVYLGIHSLGSFNSYLHCDDSYCRWILMEKDDFAATRMEDSWEQWYSSIDRSINLQVR
ncbi:hypothetical protein BC941DRAFT_422450 [Chlamydoabsidia padenii]|nr:hypothetical protein BC941DRAFT_422450 [Chlamydoabsidia padenii]